LNIDSRGGLGYIHIRRYIFAPPGGTRLLRRLQNVNILQKIKIFIEIFYFYRIKYPKERIASII